MPQPLSKASLHHSQICNQKSPTTTLCFSGHSALGPLCPAGPGKPVSWALQPLPSGSHPRLEQLCPGPSLHLSPPPPEAASLAPALFRQMGTELGVPPIPAALRGDVFPSGTQTLLGESLYISQAHLPLHLCACVVSGNVVPLASLWPQFPTPGQKPHMPLRLGACSSQCLLEGETTDSSFGHGAVRREGARADRVSAQHLAVSPRLMGLLPSDVALAGATSRQPSQVVHCCSTGLPAPLRQAFGGQSCRPVTAPLWSGDLLESNAWTISTLIARNRIWPVISLNE